MFQLYDEVAIKWYKNKYRPRYLSEYRSSSLGEVSEITGFICELLSDQTYQYIVAVPSSTPGEYGPWPWAFGIHQPKVIKTVRQQHKFWCCCDENLVKL